MESLQLADLPARVDVRARIAFLEQQKAFEFPAYSTGLFSAAAGDSSEIAQTGYRSVWIRDNIHIAHALLKIGQTEAAVKNVQSIARFLLRSADRFRQCIAHPELAAEPMNRPHIRFDGNGLVELPEKWSHAQNDALGAFLWLYCQLIAAKRIALDDGTRELLGLMVRYFAAIRFWIDEDSGHWEEVRKQSASSIGAALAGLKSCSAIAAAALPDLVATIDELVSAGQETLLKLLPYECRQENPALLRRYDAALLFLIAPFDVVSSEMARTLLQDICNHLAGPIGIRRYLGDSYWCADYKELLSADVRTSDFSDDLESRDRLLKPGFEAQWCLFDPIVSIAYGRLYRQSNDPADRARQVEYVNRALAQLTTSSSRFGPYRCPESYFCERGNWVPNDITPLLWTQANLRWALHELETSLD